MRTPEEASPSAPPSAFSLPLAVPPARRECKGMVCCYGESPPRTRAGPAGAKLVLGTYLELYLPPSSFDSTVPRFTTVTAIY